MEPVSAGIAAGAALGTTALNIQGAKIASKRQLKYQKELAQFQADINQRYLREQLAYNSPEQQMMRYKAAGINPNMVISQGNPGNQGAPLSYPEIQAPDVQYERGIGTQALNSILDVVMKSRQAELLESQASLNNVKKDSETINQDLKKVQTEVAKANPYLNQSYVNAMVTQLQAVASMKKQEADFLLQETTANQKDRYFIEQEGGQYTTERGWLKLSNQLRLLDQKFELGEKDQAVKAQIIQSKEFQNALQQIQVEWMQDGSITSQHIYQGIMLLLGKLIGK